jgi:hypothetical protein
MAKNNNVFDSETEKTEAADVNAAETRATAAPPAKGRYSGITNFAYVGPSLPGGRLKSLTVLNGTYEQVAEYYREAIELFPTVAKLIVPVANLAESREKIEKGGNLMSKQYQELTAEIKARGDEK